MPLVQTRGAASAQGFGEFAQAAVAANYIEDVFSTFLYTGTGATQTITNNIDLSTEGGLVWIKPRSLADNHSLFDTARGALNRLRSNDTTANVVQVHGLNAFNTTGFSITGANGETNQNTITYASWTFREQPKFFDVVTYTGNGTGERAIAHNLGSVPGCVIVKKTSATGSWGVWHRGDGVSAVTYFDLNTTAAGITSVGNTAFTSATTFTVDGLGPAVGGLNDNGATYVAYLFAHNAGGFGLTGTDNVISCGTFTLDGSNTATVTLGYEPQWVMIKRTNAVANWVILDNMRGLTTSGVDAALKPNTSGAETNGQEGIYPTATGFGANTGLSSIGDTYIYIAIRRGPMKVPTLGTSVFSPIAYTGNSTTNTTVQNLTTSFAGDAVIIQQRNTLGNAPLAFDKLRGSTQGLYTSRTSAEENIAATRAGQSVGFNNTQTVLTGQFTDFGNYNYLSDTLVGWNFRRAPGFFDEVCYTGTGANGQVINHNLSAIPEMVIIKGRDSNSDWFVYQAGLSSGNSIYLNRNYAQSNDGGPAFSLSTTALTISRTYVSNLNSSAVNYVAYLFATCAGVSKVGSYTGTGTTLQINCGFTAGARFVLIKRTDSTGDWYVWDSARGIVAGNDPYLLLNSTAAEVTGTDYVDTYSAGFEISSTAPAAINASAGSFIFLAIA